VEGTDNRISAYVNLKWVAALCVLLGIALIAPFFGLAVEDTQTLLFPFFVLVLFLLPRERLLKLPVAIVLLWFVFWGAGVMNVRALLPLHGGSSQLYLSRLYGDRSGAAARRFLNAYAELARRFSVPGISMIQRSFETPTAASSWLRARPDALALVSGDTEWLLFQFNRIFSQPSVELPGIAGGVEVYVPFANRKLIVVEAPQALTVGQQPIDLSKHYTAWLLEGVNWSRQGKLTPARHAFEAASEVSGPWRSLDPQGFSHFLLGTSYFIANTKERAVSAAHLSCAIMHFKRALSLANSLQSPEIASVAFNNAAVAQLVAAEDEEHIDLAKRWLERALVLKKRDGSPTRGALVALENLRRLSSDKASSPQ